jgi:GINS complex subunit 4
MTRMVEQEAALLMTTTRCRSRASSRRSSRCACCALSAHPGTAPTRAPPLGSPPSPPTSLSTQALLNERVAPEILDYRAELVARVAALLDHQDNAIAELEQQPGAEKALRRGALALERDRLRHLQKAYLRARALKIEASAAAILDSRSLCARLSPSELRLANDCFVALGRLMKAAVLDALPSNYRSLVRQFEGELGKRMIAAADRRAFVFCRALRDLGAVPDGERGETLDLSKGDLHVVRYASVADLVRRDQACLL